MRERQRAFAGRWGLVDAAQKAVLAGVEVSCESDAPEASSGRCPPAQGHQAAARRSRERWGWTRRRTTGFRHARAVLERRRGRRRGLEITCGVRRVSVHPPVRLGSSRNARHRHSRFFAPNARTTALSPVSLSFLSISIFTESLFSCSTTLIPPLPGLPEEVRARCGGHVASPVPWGGQVQ